MLMKIEKILSIFGLVQTILEALKSFLGSVKKPSSDDHKAPEENY